MKDSKVMTAKPQVIAAEETVLKAAETLACENIGALPVVKNDRLIGMITDRDIVVRVVASGRDPSKTRVEEVTNPSVKNGFEDEDVAHVAQNIDQLRKTVQVVVSMRVKCWCGYANDEDFLLDMPHDRAQPMQAYELSACPDCGAPIRIHLKRTSALQ